MTKINYIQSGEDAVGKGHATKPDSLNRGVRDLQTLSGLDPDADFAGFALPSQITSEAAARAAADTAAIATAAADATTKANAAQAAAIAAASTDATTKANGGRDAAKTYADGIVAAEASTRTAADVSAIASAKTYTDGVIATEQTARGNGDTAAVASANAHADAGDATEAAARANAVTNALTTAANDATTKAATAQSAAQVFATNAVATEATTRAQNDTATLTSAIAHADAGDASESTARAAADTSLASRVTAVEGGQGSSIIGYATQALLFADLTHAAGSIGYVNADATPANNGYYLKSGGSGTGAWTQSPYDRVALVEGRTTAVEAKTATIDPPVAGGYGAYEWAIVDSLGRVGVALMSDGTLIGKSADAAAVALRATALEAKTATTDITLPGAYGLYEWAVVDSLGRIALGVKSDGTVVGKLASAITPSAVDSAATLAHGVTVASAQQIRTITKATGVSRQVTTAGNNRKPSFSADGSKLFFTTDRNGVDEFFYVPVLGGTEYPVLPYSSLVGWGDSLTAGTGGGGTTFLTAMTAQLADGRTTFNGGVGGETSAQILTRILADATHDTWTAVLWLGRNNWSDPTTVKANIASAIAWLKPYTTRVLVLSILNSDTAVEWAGGTSYIPMMQLNADLAALYPNNWVDVRSYLVSLFNAGIPQDVIDHGHDVPPSSLRSDALHLNAAGYTAVGQYLASAITARGW